MKRLFSALLIMVLVSVVGIVGVSRVAAQPIPNNPGARAIETLEDVRLIMQGITGINNNENVINSKLDNIISTLAIINDNIIGIGSKLNNFNDPTLVTKLTTSPVTTNAAGDTLACLVMNRGLADITVIIDIVDPTTGFSVCGTPSQQNISPRFAGGVGCAPGTSPQLGFCEVTGPAGLVNSVRAVMSVVDNATGSSQDHREAW